MGEIIIKHPQSLTKTFIVRNEEDLRNALGEIELYLTASTNKRQDWNKVFNPQFDSEQIKKISNGLNY